MPIDFDYLMDRQKTLAFILYNQFEKPPKNWSLLNSECDIQKNLISDHIRWTLKTTANTKDYKWDS